MDIILTEQEVVLEIWELGSEFGREAAARMAKIGRGTLDASSRGRGARDWLYSKPGAGRKIAANPVGLDEGAVMKSPKIEIPDEILEAIDRTPEEFERVLSFVADFLKTRHGTISPEEAAELKSLAAEMASLLESRLNRRRSAISHLGFRDRSFFMWESHLNRWRSAMACTSGGSGSSLRAPEPETNAERPVHRFSPAVLRAIVAATLNETNTERLRDRFSPEEAETHYRKLGQWKGPEAATDARNESWSFWRGSGKSGASWLAQRLRNENRVETLHSASALLADLGENSIDPISSELRRDAAPDQALALLRALGWLKERCPDRVFHGSFELTLADYLQRDDPDIREAAARGMRLLRPDRAVRSLTYRLRDESDADVRTTIEEELAYHQART